MNLKTITSLFFVIGLSIQSSSIFAENKQLASSAPSQSNIQSKIQSRISKSFSYKSSKAKTPEAKAALKRNAKVFELSPLLEKEFQLPKTQNFKTNHHYDPDYSIYSITTELLSDIDYDGYHHRFSIEIDADTAFEHASVYADIYLSYEDGPWILLASSDEFDLHYDEFHDAFLIESELVDGYPTGHYDAKVVLYDAHNDEWLLSYDSWDDSALYAIPLEDSANDHDEYFYNEPHADVIFSHGVGSFNWLVFPLLFLLMYRAKRSNNIQLN